MQLGTFQNIMGMSFIAAQLAVILHVCIETSRGGFLGDEALTVLAIVLPMLAGYVTAFIKHVRDVDTADEKVRQSLKQPVTHMRVALTFVLLATIVAAFHALTWAKSHNVGQLTFSGYRTALGIIQTVVGVHLGTLVAGLFELRPGKRATTTRGSPPPRVA